MKKLNATPENAVLSSLGAGIWFHESMGVVGLFTQSPLIMLLGMGLSVGAKVSDVFTNPYERLSGFTQYRPNDYFSGLQHAFGKALVPAAVHNEWIKYRLRNGGLKANTPE